MIGILDQAEQARDEMSAWLQGTLGSSTVLPDEGVGITHSTRDGLFRHDRNERGVEVGM